MPYLKDRLIASRIKMGLTQAEVASYLKIEQPSYARWETGINNPKRKYIPLLARLFKTSETWLEFGKNEHELSVASKVPVLKWSEIGIDTSSLLKPMELVDVCGEFSKKSYVLRIKDDSMTSERGDRISFLIDDMILVDPDIVPKHGDYVIVKENDASEAMLKQYLVHGKNIILNSLNKDYRQLEYNKTDFTIDGVVIDKHTKIHK